MTRKKTYGRSSSSLVMGYLLSNNLKEIELSDQEEYDESDDQQPLDDQSLLLDSQRSYNNSNVIHGPRSTSAANNHSEESSLDDVHNKNTTMNVPTIDSNSETSIDVSNLEAFDFLNETNRPKKMRRTNYKRQSLPEYCADKTDISAAPVRQTIEDLNHLLSSLRNTDDHFIEKILNDNFQNSTQEKDSTQNCKIIYGSDRTMLYSEEDGSLNEEEEDADVNMYDATKNNGKDNGTTHHFNELKNMGDFLKYQDDLDFLTRGSMADMKPEGFISKLLSMSLAISNDEGFQKYLIKENLSKVRRFCFNSVVKDPFILLFQGYLLANLAFTSADLPSSAREIVLSMVSEKSVPDGSLLKHKITRLNYKDFLTQTKMKSAQTYALELCCIYPRELSSPSFAHRVFRLSGERTTPLPLFKCIEILLSTETEHCVMHKDGDAIFLLKSLLWQLPKDSSNEYLLKSIILLTNDASLLRQLSAEEKSFAYRDAIELIIAKARCNSGDFADILILHLGFALNVITQSHNLTLKEFQWEKFRGLIYGIESSEVDDGKKFTNYMLYLNFAYMTNHLNKTLPFHEKASIINVLEKFDEESERYNETIHEKINVALRKLL